MKFKPLILGFGLILFAAMFAGFSLPSEVQAAPTEAQLCGGFTRLGTAGCTGYFSGANFYGPNGISGFNIIDCNIGVAGCTGDQSINNSIPDTGPDAVNSAASFEAFIIKYLGTGATGSGYNYNRAGAAFIVDAMLGRTSASFGGSVVAGIQYAQTHLTEWETDVNFYDSQGKVQWNHAQNLVPGQINSMHVCVTSQPDCTVDNISSNDGKDFAFFAMQDVEASHLIIFTNPTGSNFEIRRECANLVGNIVPLTPPPTATPTCGGVIVDPARPDPDTPFTITAAVNYATAAQATSAVGAGDKMFITVSSGFNNPNVPITQNGKTLNGTANVGATGVGGYTISYGITGSIGAITCPGSVTIANEPYFTTSGGDVEAGAQMGVGGTDCATPADPHAGVVSWNQENAAYDGAGTQYAAYALNYLQDFATAQSSAGRPSGLAFANTVNVNDPHTGADTYGGGFGTESCVPDYYSNHPAAATFTGNHTLVAGDLSKTIFIQTGDLTIPNDFNIPNGSHTTVYVDGNVQINGNIQFSDNYPGGVGDIPSFAIIANGNIYIAKAVSQLDGLYVAEPSSAGANGVVYTCASGFAAPALDQTLYNNCNSQLTVNGSVIAKQVWLTRTAGTLHGGTPSEAFNFSPEVWLSSPPAVSGGTNGAGAYDAYTTLPPIL